MSTQAPETSEQTVATAASDVGKTVWCPQGHGSRILEADERVGFPCPACTLPMTETPPEQARRSGVKVQLPEVGRIVHVRLTEEITRPAIVMGRNGDGRCLVTVFAHANDPKPPGFRDPTPVLWHGDGVGCWHWPPQGKTEHFESFDR